MPLLARYILTEYLKFIGILLAAFLMIFLTIHTLEKVRWFSDAPLIGIMQYFLLKIPKMISDLMPLSLLLATLLTLGTLSRNNEWVPMMSAGMRTLEGIAPLLAVGGVVSLLFVFLNGSFVPYTLHAARTVQQEKIEKRGPGAGGTFAQNKIWFRVNAKTLLYTQLVDPATHTLYGVHLYYLGGETPLVKEIEATALRYQGGKWILVEGTRIEYQKNGVLIRIPFEQEEIEMGQTLAEMQQIAVRPEEMTHTGLSSYIRKLQESELDARPYQVALHVQRAFPWAGFILTLLGIPVAFLYLRKGGVMKSVILGLGIVLIYWLLISVSGALGRLGVIVPLVAGWGPHLLFLLVGVSLLFNLHRTLF